MTLRWIERFDNYKQSLANFNKTYDCINKEGINNIYIMALVQAYEMAFELAWKTIKDYLEYQGIKADTPRETIKAAFLHNLLDDGETWIQMMETRNKTSHIYKEDLAKEVANNIINKYHIQLNNLEQTLNEKING